MEILSGNIENTFAVLSPTKQASLERKDETLYQRLQENYVGFSGHELISCHAFTEDWSTWEIHPKGDEIVILLSGSLEFVLQLPKGERTMQLSGPGDYVVVPKNIWHTARLITDAKALFITPGEGTQNKDV